MSEPTTEERVKLLERNLRAMIQICHGFYFAWRQAATEIAGTDKTEQLVRRFYEIVGEDTARLYEEAGLGSTPYLVAKALERSSLIMGETARAERGENEREARLVHTVCPWKESHDKRGLLHECNTGCDQWFLTTMQGLSPNLRVETLSSLARGDSTCTRRIWKE